MALDVAHNITRIVSQMRLHDDCKAEVGLYEVSDISNTLNAVSTTLQTQGAVSPVSDKHLANIALALQVLADGVKKRMAFTDPDALQYLNVQYLPGLAEADVADSLRLRIRFIWALNTLAQEIGLHIQAPR